MQLAYGASSVNPVFCDKVDTPLPSPGNNGPWNVFLGKMPCPLWSDPIVHGYSGSAMKALVPFVGLYAERLAGSGTLQIDYLYFMPADESTLIVDWPSDLVVYAADGTTEAGGACYATVAALDEVIGTTEPARIVGGGGFPMVTPGATNRVHLMRNVDPNGSVDPLTSNTTVRAYYWPQMREITRT
jgi:hypothetical protein